ncbi:MAG TPA: hypothetical protein VNN10_00470 [Dehalococcoidia bacterium]|nr:hypothetical protein [Dehalococcoidia bacterium]
MVQAGSAYDYDDSREDRRPEIRALEPVEAEMGGGALQQAMRALVASVSATYQQFAHAAENFAREAMRAMEEYAARAEHSAGESREMADVAGRAAEDARGISSTLESVIAEARAQIRGDIEAMLADVRPQIDEAVRAANEALATAREAAEEARRKTDEALERIEASVEASRAASAAAEAAAEAARRSAESVEMAVAEARHGLHAEAARVDDEAAARVEQSLKASQEAAVAAERAAEDARAAALEAMTHAAEARRPAPEDPGTQALLDRLEADYQLIAELIKGLQSRLASLDRGAEVAMPADLQQTGMQSEEEEPQPEASWAAWSTSSPASPTDESSRDEGQSAWAVEEAAPSEVQAPGEVSVAAESRPEALGPAETARSEWTEHVWPAEEVIGPEAASAAREPAAGYAEAQAWAGPSASETPEATDQAWPVEAEPEAAGDQGEDHYDGAIQWPSPATASGADYERSSDAWHADKDESLEPSPQPDEPASGAPFPLWSHPDYTPAPTASMVEEEAGATTSAGGSGAAMLEGRLVLTIAPVPDFDRLLSLDGALGRLSKVENVTLADYAREEVTFRVEIGSQVSAEAFARELAEAIGQGIEILEAGPGTVALRITGRDE